MTVLEAQMIAALLMPRDPLLSAYVHSVSNSRLGLEPESHMGQTRIHQLMVAMKASLMMLE